MISYEEFLALKEEKLRFERDNLRLKNEIYQLMEMKEQILPMKTILIEKYREQNQEKDEKIASLESTISIFRNQVTNKNDNDIIEQNNLLIQKIQKLKAENKSLKTLYKQKEEEFSQKCKQNEAEIFDLKTLITKSFQQVSVSDNNEISNQNNQLNNTLQILNRKYKTLKIKSKIKITELSQQNQEKEAEIQSLRDQIDQIKGKIQSLPEYKEEEMNNQYKKLFAQSQNLLDMKEAKIQSLEDTILKLKNEHIHHDSNCLDENDKLNQKNKLLKTKINELRLKNKETEEKVKSLEGMKADFIQSNNESKQLLLQCKQRIIELNNEKKDNEVKIKSFETIINEMKNQNSQSKIQNQINQSNQQTQELKIENEKTIQSQQENDSKIKNQTSNKKGTMNQNLTKNCNENKRKIKNLEDMIKKQNFEIDNKEKFINKLKLIINSDQDKMNRMETEIICLKKQIEIHQNNNQQISDFIQSYKQQNSELQVAFDNIQKSNHSLKNEICSILSDLSEKIEDNIKKNSFINELKAEISLLSSNKKDETSKNQQNDNLIESLYEKFNKLDSELIEIKNQNEILRNKNNELMQNSIENNDKNQMIIEQLNEKINEKNDIINELKKQVLYLTSGEQEDNANHKHHSNEDNNNVLSINEQINEPIKQFASEILNDDNNNNENVITLEKTEEMKQKTD